MVYPAFKATVRNGRIQLLDDIELPAEAVLLVAMTDVCHGEPPFPCNTTAQYTNGSLHRENAIALRSHACEVVVCSAAAFFNQAPAPPKGKAHRIGIPHEADRGVTCSWFFQQPGSPQLRI